MERLQGQLLRQLRQKMGQAINRFGLIDNGDNIAVGLSGGKDSLTLLYMLARLQRYAPVRFGLQAITLGMTPDVDSTPLADFCQRLGVPFHFIPTQITEIVFDRRREKHPCSLCANLRRGALNNAAKDAGCNKVALGHHWDDVIETLLLSLFYEGRLHTFSPRTYLSRKKLTVIRPLVFVPESTLIAAAAQLSLPVIANCCPANGRTQRQAMKALVQAWEKEYPNIRSKLLSAVQNIDIDPQWQD